MNKVHTKHRVWKKETLKKEILKWWYQFRPKGWSIRAHIENPTVNTTNEWNTRMAKIAAGIARAKFVKRDKERLTKMLYYKKKNK